MVGISGVQKPFQGVVSGLSRLSVQIQRSRRRQLTFAETVPGGFVKAGGRLAGGQRWPGYGTLRPDGWRRRRFGGSGGGRRRRLRRVRTAWQRADMAGVVGPMRLVMIGQRAGSAGHPRDTSMAARGARRGLAGGLRDLRRRGLLA